MINILSLGAGVQSTYVLKKWYDELDYIIFADTGNEPQSVYDHLAKLKKDHPKIETVHHKHGENIYSERGAQQIPAFLNNGGFSRRQCTGEWKILPIQRRIKEILGLKPRQHWPKEPVVRLWQGISYDELQRMRDSQIPAIEHYYPLVENKIYRYDCMIYDAPEVGVYHLPISYQRVLETIKPGRIRNSVPV